MPLTTTNQPNDTNQIAPRARPGTRLGNPTTAEEAIADAGLDFQVELHQLRTDAGLRVSRRRAVVRSDTRDVLGVVTKSYQPVQNREAFSFLNSLVREGSLTFETAGAIDRGARVWMLANLPGVIRVRASDDATKKYLLLSNSHDGSSALRVFYTGIRVVCENSLRLALRQGQGEGVTIQHRGNLQAKVREARKVLGLADELFADFAERADFLAAHQANTGRLDGYFRLLFPDPDQGNPARRQNVRNRLAELFESGRGQDIPQVRHSWWAAFNAVTEYQDFFRPTRGRDDNDRAENRLDSGWFGSGALLKQRAFSLALKFAAGEIPTAMAA